MKKICIFLSLNGNVSCLTPSEACFDDRPLVDVQPTLGVRPLVNAYSLGLCISVSGDNIFPTGLFGWTYIHTYISVSETLIWRLNSPERHY